MSRYSRQIIDHFILEEGYRNRAYKDTHDNWTIGVGHLLGKDDAFGAMVWSDQKIIEVLENDIDTAARHARTIFPHYETLPDNVKLGILDMIFNLGGGGFRKFVITIRLINESKFLEASESAAGSRWASQVPNRAKRTVKLLSNT